MDITDITPGLDRLIIDLDQLETDLKPLLADLGTISSKLPLLDKAKLYVLTSYAIESLLFSSLRLNGVDTKNHAVFTELTRVRQYFDKIKQIETPAPQRESAVDTQAAIRFIRSDLAGNKELKNKLSEQLAKERTKAALNASKGAMKRSADEAEGPKAGVPAAGSSQGQEATSKRSRHSWVKKK